jgi:superfamily II DNA/RNA helicase
VIIFVKSIQRAQKLAEQLSKELIPTKAIHRQISQEER